MIRRVVVFPSILFLAAVIVTTSVVVSAAPDEDFVASLPLFGPTPTPQYSGYLDGTSGCNTSVNGDSCKIHYLLALAKSKEWQTKPVVLWLNGGPGASSVVGFLQENGPLLINATGGLMENPYAWTNVANLFVMESPVGVGFSYCKAQQQNGGGGRGGYCENTDKYTASTARAALVDFFLHKFPEFQSNDFYITGESYAGVYIPTLAYEILQYNKNDAAAAPNINPTTQTVIINLRGLAVGDPCTDNESQGSTMNPLWYAHKYGLVDDAIYDVLTKKCDLQFRNELMKLMKTDGAQVSHHLDAPYKPLERNMAKSDDDDDDDDVCTLAIRKYFLSSSHGIWGKWHDRFVDRYSLFAPVTDVVDRAMETYMNRKDVQSALHVQEAPIDKWTMHALDFDYTKEYDACNHDVVDKDTPSMIDFYQKIVPKLDRVWIYNGDTDPAVTYEGTRTAVKRIGFSEIDGGGYRPWFYNHTAVPLNVLQEKAVLFGPDLLLQGTGAQFGGEVVNYEHDLAFLTVHGSGHMVPQFRPQAALQLITKFVQGKELSPLMPPNATLTSMSKHEFSKILDDWTTRAKSAPYAMSDGFLP